MIFTSMVWWQLLQSTCLIWHGEKKPACLSLALPHHGSRGSTCTGIAVGSTWTRGTCAQDAMCPKQPLPWRTWQPCVRHSAETHIGTARLLRLFWLHFPNTTLCPNNQKYVDTDTGTAFTWPPHYKKFSEVLDCFLINVFCLKRREADHENIPLSLYALSR